MQTKSTTALIESTTRQISLDGEPYALFYSLISHQSPDGGVIFSLAVALASAADPSDRESEFIFDVTRDPDIARHIYQIITENEVTPPHLREVLAELLAE